MTERPLPPWRRLLPASLQRMPSGWGPLGNELLLVTPIYVLLSLVFTFPLVLNFTGYVIGDLEGDMWKHLWGMWWVKLNLVEQNTLPLYTDLLNYPYGGALFFIDPMNGLLATPLQLLWPPTVVYNLLVLFNLVLGCVGAFCLARSLTRNPYASFFAGAVYGFSAYMMAYITSGVTEAINIGWIPFFALFFIRMVHNNRLSDAVRAGVAFALATIGCWYYGSFCVLFAFFYWLYGLTRLYRRPLRLLVGKAAQALRPPWSPVVTCGLAILVLSVFILWRLPKLLDPFRGDSSDFLFVSAALVLAGSLAVRLRGGTTGRSAAAWQAFLKVLPALLALLFEAWLLIGTLLVPGDAPLALLGVQGVVVVGAALWALHHGREHLQALRSLLQPHGPFLVSLALLGLSSLAIWVGMRYLGQAGAEWIVGAAIVVVALSSSLVLRHARLPFPDEQGDVLAEYRRFFSAHATGLVVLTLGSVPLLRLLLPDVTAVPFMAAWFAVQALLQLGLAALLALQRAATEHLREERFREVAGSFWARMVQRPVLMVLVAAVFVTGPAVSFKRTLNTENSIVFRDRKADGVDLYLSNRFLNVSKLVDYVRPGKSHATRSYTVDKLTRVAYAGWVTLGVILFGLAAGLRRRLFRFWLLMAAVFAMFSLGPFLYVTESLYSGTRSPIYMAFYLWFPLFSQVSIPYRFTAMAMLSLGMLSAFTLAGLFRRRRPVEQGLLVAALTGALLFDVAMFSPAPFPIPLSSVDAPTYCQRLAEEPGDFAILDLPFQRYKGELLPGEYFYYQMIHRKAIPNKVEGTIPVYVFQNPFSNYLFVLEHSYQNLPPRSRAELEKGLEDLSLFKFRYIVVHDNYLRASARERVHAMLRFYLGEPEAHPDNVFLYRIPLRLRFVDGVATSVEDPASARRKEVAAP